MLGSLRCCLNGKVIGGLLAVGLILWLADGSGTTALPLLVTLLCPLSMGVMLWQMRKAGSGAPPDASNSTAGPSGEQQTEGAALLEQRAIERARRQLGERSEQSRD